MTSEIGYPDSPYAQKFIAGSPKQSTFFMSGYNDLHCGIRFVGII